MGKYTKKPKLQKVKNLKTVQRGLKNSKKKKSKKMGKGNKRGSAQTNMLQQVRKRASLNAAEGANGIEDGDAAMADDNSALNEAGDRLVAFLRRHQTESKARDALAKALNADARPLPAAMGAALVHLAGRGLDVCVRMLIDCEAPVNACDPTQPPGRQTALQLAASRGHVNVCRRLVAAGADKTGALEASQELTKLGAVFRDEFAAIKALLTESNPDSSVEAMNEINRQRRLRDASVMAA